MFLKDDNKSDFNGQIVSDGSITLLHHIAINELCLLSQALKVKPATIKFPPQKKHLHFYA